MSHVVWPTCREMGQSLKHARANATSHCAAEPRNRSNCRQRRDMSNTSRHSLRLCRSAMLCVTVFTHVRFVLWRKTSVSTKWCPLICADWVAGRLSGIVVMRYSSLVWVHASSSVYCCSSALRKTPFLRPRNIGGREFGKRELSIFCK